jgi:flagellar basal-body rod modification protein FlgD
MNPISLSNAGPMSGTGNSPAPVSAAAAAGSQVTKNMFLQLLVAQIKNQDPLNPTDGVQFLTQLAQFQQLEQSLNMSQDLAAVRTDLDKIVQNGAPINTTPAP